MPLSVGPIHHLRLTVTDVERSTAFYTEVLGFGVAVGGPPPPDDEHHDAIVDSLQGGVILIHGDTFIGLRPAGGDAGAADRFDPLRVGLDHLSFGVASRADLDDAASVLDERGVEHGPLRELVPLGLVFLAFSDPDGIALELTAPLAAG